MKKQSEIEFDDDDGVDAVKELLSGSSEPDRKVFDISFAEPDDEGAHVDENFEEWPEDDVDDVVDDDADDWDEELWG